MKTQTIRIKHILRIALLGSALAVTPAFAGPGHDHGGHGHGDKGHAKEGHAKHMLEGYNEVATALFKDDFAAAKSAAMGMVKHDKTSSLAPSAKKISKATDIEEARVTFDIMSKRAIMMAKGSKEWKTVHCPMALGGKGANWLQKSSDKKVNNPYFGAKMAHCGRFTK